MRTKSLLLAAAALAAGVLSSQAQTVYSANIVGYVNTPLNPGFASVANPLDIGGGNSLTNIIVNVGGALDGDLVYVWNVTQYTIYTIDSSKATGLADSADVNALPSPTIDPGELFYFDNTYNVGYTNTFVGTVHTDGAAVGTGTIGVTTNVLTTGFNFVSSKLPIAGGVSSVLGLTNVITAGVGALDGDLLYVPNISTAGAFLGYDIITIDSSKSTGFADSADVNAVPEPVIPVGGGFIFDNTYTSSVSWIQSY